MIMGIILVKTDLVNNLRTIEIIGWTTLIFAILLYFSDRFRLDKNLKSDFSYKECN